MSVYAALMFGFVCDERNPTTTDRARVAARTLKVEVKEGQNVMAAILAHLGLVALPGVHVDHHEYLVGVQLAGTENNDFSKVERTAPTHEEVARVERLWRLLGGPEFAPAPALRLTAWRG